MTNDITTLSTTDAYPMPFFATLGVADVAASQRWYAALGFATVYAMPGADGAPVLVHLRWCRYADVLLRAAAADAPGPKGLGLALTFRVEREIDALAARAQSLGARVLMPIGDRPWNVRDFTLADPDGFALTFSFGPLKELDFPTVMRGAAP